MAHEPAARQCGDEQRNLIARRDGGLVWQQAEQAPPVRGGARWTTAAPSFVAAKVNPVLSLPVSSVSLY